jgi:ABC-type branched-subunit amino acid transport system substrate-binding protein
MEMKEKKSRLFFGVLAVFVLAFVGISEAQKKKVPGVEKDKVYVGTSQPFSGPAAAWGIVAKSMETYFQYVNEKKGGVHGRKIVLLARDDGYQPARMRANIEELHSKVLLFASPLGTANVSANKDLIAGKKVPTIAPLGNVRMWVGYPWEKLKYFFVAYTDYLDEGKELAKFAIEKLGSQKIAIFYQNDDYGETGLKGVESAAQDKLVLKVSHELADVDFSVHAQKIKDAGADTVIIYSNPRQTAAFVKKLSELGVKPKILASFPLADPVMVHLAGEAWDGAYVGGVIKLPQLYPESKQIFDEIVKLNPELAKTPFLTLYGIFVGALVEEALRRAGPEPTREKIIEALENMEKWESPVSFPITFGKKRRHGINAIGLWRVSKDGKYEQVMEPKFLDPLF